MAKTFGVVDILVSSKPPEYGLPQHPHESVPAVLSRACVGEPLAGPVRKTERVIKFTVGEQTGVRGDDRTAKGQTYGSEIHLSEKAIRKTTSIGTHLMVS